MAASPHRRVLRSLDPPLDATAVHGRGGGRAPGSAQPPRLVVVSGPRAGTIVALAGDELTVGRAWDNDVVLPDISVSRRHALLRRHGAGYLLLDQGSGNGTRVNGRKIDKARLRSGDEIVLGDSVVQFIEAGGTAVCGAAAAASAPGGPGWRRGPLRSRGATYAATAALLLAATSVGLWRRLERERVATEASEQRPRVRAPARQRSDQGASLLHESQWAQAAGELKPAAEPDPEQPPVEATLERAGSEASQVQALTQAAADRARPDALELKGALAGQRRQGSAARPTRRAPPVAPSIAEAFLAGDLDLAIERARAARAEPAAAHLRAAPAKDPGNEDARDQLGGPAARANEAYLSGYVAKDSDPDAARRAFRLVVAALPATDETAVKARRWLDRLDGKAGED
jgi:hypothetical protein